MSHQPVPAKHQRPAAPAASQPRPQYQPPRLESLGRWEAITLIGSIGFNSVPGLGQHEQ